MSGQPPAPAGAPLQEPRKQFIAGASCPACERLDSVRLWFVAGVPHRDCVACGHTDRLDESGEAIPLVALDEGAAR